MLSIKDILSLGAAQLSGISQSPGLDAEVLLSHVLRRDRAYLFANPHLEISKSRNSKFQRLVEKRAKYWPVAYLTQHKAFFDLDLRVTPDVLVPRPETELLVERALAILKARSYKLEAVIDIGTGSGCVIISLAKSIKNPRIKFLATDISTKALKIAKQNAKTHGVLKKISFRHCNLIENCKLKIVNSLVIANLPYLTDRQYSSNPFLKHEPRSALVGGPDGLKYFKEFFLQIKKLSAISYKLKATLLLEFDPFQKSALTKLARKYFGGQAKLSFHRDLAGKPRVGEFTF